MAQARVRVAVARNPRDRSGDRCNAKNRPPRSAADFANSVITAPYRAGDGTRTHDVQLGKRKAHLAGLFTSSQRTDEQTMKPAFAFTRERSFTLVCAPVCPAS